VSWGALAHFPCKLRLKKIFSALGVQVHLLHPLATPMEGGLLCIPVSGNGRNYTHFPSKLRFCLSSPQ